LFSIISPPINRFFTKLMKVINCLFSNIQIFENKPITRFIYDSHKKSIKETKHILDEIPELKF